MLAELAESGLAGVYAADRYGDRPTERADLTALRTELARVRREGFAVNRERSERGLGRRGSDRDQSRRAPVCISGYSCICRRSAFPARR